MNVDELTSKLKSAVKKYIDDTNALALIDKAIDFSLQYYAGIKHYDGSDYTLHALRTAIILTDLHSDATTIVSGLIHWLVALNEKVTLDMIEQEFGENIAMLVENLQKINSLRLTNPDEFSATYLRKVLVGLSSDVRVIIIKMAGRLDNLRYVYTVKDNAQKEKCIETQNVLIPIAHRLGINYIKSELEDLCLKYLNEEAYKEIEKELNETRETLSGYLDEMKDELTDLMSENSIKCRIKGRVKSIFSLYEKMNKGKTFNQIYDVLALRIIVEKESDCYLAIGLIHAKYRPIPKRFKDYIAQPKENMYQSLHTGVIGPNGNIFEIQIRTEEMDEIDECGIASHWSYKEHGSKSIQSLMEQKLELFRDSMEISEDDISAINEFNELFAEKMIYVFTPNGDVIELPEGSTPIDFAYRIHSNIGNSLVGAIVNDQIVPIDSKLKNDDIVKINTSANSEPKKEWLDVVKTSKAKSLIKAYLNRQDRENLLLKGDTLLIKEARNRKESINELLSEVNIEKICKETGAHDLDDIKVLIGSLKYTAKQILGFIDKKEETIDISKLTSSKNETIKHNTEVIVPGCSDVLVTMANCCMPINGDEIVGFITKGNGITVHKKDCVNIKCNRERCIAVEWNTSANNKSTARIMVKTNSNGNNILEIVAASAKRDVNIVSIDTRKKEYGTDYEMLVDVEDKDTLNLYMQDLHALKFVISVERINK